MNPAPAAPQGLVVLSGADHSRPWLVTGGGRSGTSGLALVCQALGLRLLHLAPHTTEHKRVQQAVDERDLEWIRDFRTEWVAGCVVKVPSLGVIAAREPQVAAALDCNYLFSMRDPVAEVFHDSGQHPHAHVGELMRTRTRIAQQSVTSAILLSQRTGVLMVSYEKLIQSTSNTALIAHLCTLMGGRPNNVEAAVGVVSPEDAHYRKSAYTLYARIRERSTET